MISLYVDDILIAGSDPSKIAKIKVEFTFSVHELKILLESTSYFLDGMEDDEEHEFKANKVDVAELNQTLEKIVKRDNKFP